MQKYEINIFIYARVCLCVCVQFVVLKIDSFVWLNVAQCFGGNVFFQNFLFLFLF